MSNDTKRRGLSPKELLFAALSGAVLALAFPPLKTGFLAYAALVPLFLLIEDGRPRGGFLAGFAVGVVFHAAALYWIGGITVAGMLFAILLLSTFLGVFALLLNVLTRRFGARAMWAAPFLWTAVEYLRSQGELGFPWTALGSTQTYYPSLIQFATITGVYGVSFWIVTLNVVALRLIRAYRNRRRSIVWGVVLAALFAVPYTYGRMEIPDRELPGDLKIAVVQPNIPPEMKWRDSNGLEISFEALERMTVEASQYTPDLVVWPETATPCYLRLRARYRGIVQELADSLQIPILTGAPDYDVRTQNAYNAAFLFSPGERRLQQYNKINLVPISERVPFRDLLPLLGKIKWDVLETGNWGQAFFSRGTEWTVFQHPRGPFSVLICFESIFPDLVRKFARGGARFLVNITNDAWFGRSSAPHQHARAAVFRAIENRIGIARSANTGVSMFVDPYGRTFETTRIFTPALRIGSLPLRAEETFYTRYGNLFSLGCTLISAGALLAALILRLRRTGDHRRESR